MTKWLDKWWNSFPYVHPDQIFFLLITLFIGPIRSSLLPLKNKQTTTKINVFSYTDSTLRNYINKKTERLRKLNFDLRFCPWKLNCNWSTKLNAQIFSPSPPKVNSTFMGHPELNCSNVLQAEVFLRNICGGKYLQTTLVPPKTNDVQWKETVCFEIKHKVQDTPYF